MDGRKILQGIAIATFKQFLQSDTKIYRALRVSKLCSIYSVKQELPMLWHGKTLFSLYLLHNFKTV